MIDFPKLIEENTRYLAESGYQLSTMRERVAAREAQLLRQILTETNENGKPRYSNDDARKAAYITLKASDHEAESLSEQIRHLEMERGIAQGELEQLRGQFKLHLLDRQTAIALPLSA